MLQFEKCIFSGLTLRTSETSKLKLLRSEMVNIKTFLGYILDRLLRRLVRMQEMLGFCSFMLVPVTGPSGTVTCHWAVSDRI